MSSEPLLRVGLTAGYGDKTILRDLRFELRCGEILGLAGASGAGKSTLVLSLLGLLPWRCGRVSGEVAMQGENLLALSESQWRRLRGRRIGLIPQSPMSALNPAVSLQRQFREAWRAHEDNQEEFRTRLHRLLEEVQLPASEEFLRRKPAEISVGQAQRVLIAMALLHRPSLIVADEPTSALDPVTQVQIVDLLKRVNRGHGAAILYVSHDLVSAIQLGHRIAVLADGAIVEDLPVAELDSARHPSTISLLQALPVPPEILVSFRDSSGLTSTKCDKQADGQSEADLTLSPFEY
jgi:peptide/nickel transport system ATP-binding protein